MRRALDRPGDLDSPAARQALDMMVGVLPYIVGKKVGAPDGSTVVLVLTGPLAHHRRGGRGRRPGPHGRSGARRTRPSPSPSPRTSSPASPAGGPIPSEALVTGVVAIDGDVVLGGEIVRQLNYMF